MPRPKIKPPAFQWYPKDFYTDPVVMNMSLEAEGAYRRLIDVCWLEDGLPTEPEHLWRLAKCRSLRHFMKLWKVIAPKFVPYGTRLQHKRVRLERKRQALWRAKCVKAGLKSAEMRRRQSLKVSSTTVQPALFNSSSSSAVRTETPLSPLERGDRPITRAERTTAIGILTRNLGGYCPHDPACPTPECCVEFLALERRAKTGARPPPTRH